MSNLFKTPIKNVLLDINGVLYDSSVEHAIEGSVDALARLEQKFNICLVTNECTTPRRLLAAKLNEMGFTSITPEKIISPAPVACDYIVSTDLVPRFHVWDGIMEDFQPVIDNLRSKSKLDDHPNCIVVGDSMSKISRDFMDESLEIMLNAPEKPQIISLGSGRYYKDGSRLRMDTGCYVKAFEFALGVTATNWGKPSRLLFGHALNFVGSDSTPQDTIMIGDDIVSDVGGAQDCYMRGVLVRTGKYKKSDEEHPNIKADAVFDNLSQAVNALLKETC